MAIVSGTPRVARRLHIRGVVQGVGFRPFVFRLATEHGLDGWVLNGDDGVHIHIEGAEEAIDRFSRAIEANPPQAARIAAVTVEACAPDALTGFEIKRSESDRRPTTRISPDLPVCGDCLREMCDSRDRRFRYPYINCTNCGPRFSIIVALPYDRAQTTMAGWPLCAECAAEYHDPVNRRFHAQPVACASCGPGYLLVGAGTKRARDGDAIVSAVRLLRDGRIVAVKGIGGYHLACDAENTAAVGALRDRKYRKEQPFAVMARDIVTAEDTVRLTAESRELLMSVARPIVLAPWRRPLAGVAPDNSDLGVMLPYAPLHHLLFEAGAPPRLVMTSGNLSSEPIAYTDDDALSRLGGLADAFLIGERPIARRVDDSVMRAGALGPVVLRRSRGLAPAPVAAVPTRMPILAVGGDLKNAVCLVVEGEAFVSQHIGDLSHTGSRTAFEQTIRDLLDMYAIDTADLTLVHDLHPEYASTAYATAVPAMRRAAVQHHRAHVASVMAERGAFDRRALGVAFDGTGYGDDGAIWGGELFIGSVVDGFERVAHLRPAALAGGDAAARYPVQAAAGFLNELGALPDLAAPPFNFPSRYTEACAVVRSGIRTFATTSVGRLFDTVAALVGFTRPITFEGQAAMWLEHLARSAMTDEIELPFRFTGCEIDWREALDAVIAARLRGVSADVIARGFHRGLARATADAIAELARHHEVETVVLSGGVMQNDLLIADIRNALVPTSLQLWTNRQVPPNDGGICLGQAVLGAFALSGSSSGSSSLPQRQGRRADPPLKSS